MLAIINDEPEYSMRLGSFICRTHCDILLEMFLARNKMRNIRGDIRCKGASIGMYPFPHLLRRALFSEVSSHRNGKALERLSPHCHCGPARLEAISFLHR